MDLQVGWMEWPTADGWKEAGWGGRGNGGWINGLKREERDARGRRKTKYIFYIWCLMFELYTHGQGGEGKGGCGVRFL